MSYRISNCLFKLSGQRIEFSAYHPNTKVAIVAQAPKDDDKYIYIGQAPDSNFLDSESKNISELSSSGIDTAMLKGIIEKLNNILKDNYYAEDIASPEELQEAILRQKNKCFYDFVTLGLYSRNEFKNHSKKFVVAFNQRRYHSLVQALSYIKSINNNLQHSKLVIGIPRSFPAYIVVSRTETNTEAHVLNEKLLKELNDHPEFANNPVLITRKKEEPEYRPTLSLGVKSPRGNKISSIAPNPAS